MPAMSQSTHSYFEWQLSTLLLAYDAVEPIDRDDEARLAEREMRVQRELYDLVHAALPQSYRDNPAQDFPPEIVVALTKATLRRAAEIVGVISG